MHISLGDIVIDEVVELADSGVTGGEEGAAGWFHPGAGSDSVPGTLTETVQRGAAVTLQSIVRKAYRNLNEVPWRFFWQ